LFYKKIAIKKNIMKNTMLANDFEKDLFRLINKYCKRGLKKPDLVKKMEWATGNCRCS